ncbi:MAG: hypothetical protein HZB65_00765 [Candidatus Aenigmarchaeota archaeon]|nr:hypothetical protein [Candidatus Aenigmarchaeota archaeon]
MRGTTDIIWMFMEAFIAVVVTSILIIVFTPSVTGMIDEATRTQSKFLSYQIAGVISLEQSSEDLISTELILPKNSAIINITKLSVHVEFDQKNQYTYYYTEFQPFKTKLILADYVSGSGNSIDYIEISTKKYKSIIIEKSNDRIRIRANPR